MTFHHAMIYIAGDATETSVLESIRTMITKSIGFSGISLAENDSVFNESTILESPVLSFSRLDKKIIAGRYALSAEQEIANDLRANILNLDVEIEMPSTEIYQEEVEESQSSYAEKNIDASEKLEPEIVSTETITITVPQTNPELPSNMLRFPYEPDWLYFATYPWVYCHKAKMWMYFNYSAEFGLIIWNQYSNSWLYHDQIFIHN